jgi:hypothetical protein
MPEKVIDHMQEAQTLQERPIDMESNEILNAEITMKELCRNIKKLKKRKAAAEDRITNEMLINTNQQMKEVILKVYNECLSHGIYPWNTALITPFTKRETSRIRTTTDLSLLVATLGSCSQVFY